LVTKADGTKFGKSEAGNVWLDGRRTSPYAMYQFLLRSEDAVVGSYLRYFTFREREEIVALEEATALHPQRREAQHVLAHDVVALVHGEDEATKAEHASSALFSEGIRDLDEPTLLAVMAEAPSSDASVGTSIVDLLVRTGLARSNREARGFIEQGGVYVNNRKVDGVDAVLSADALLAGRYAILRRGKASQHLVRISSAPAAG
jgi:tyrosyl-tRNA synthetase